MVIPSINQIDQQLEDLIFQGLPAIAENTVRLWGSMTPQHIVEHLNAGIIVTLEKIPQPFCGKEEDLPRLKAYLLSEKPFKENVKHPLLSETELPTLRNVSLNEAKEKLLANVSAMLSLSWDDHKTITHAVFGPLSLYEWKVLHYKHFSHHYRQLGLLND